MAYSKDYKERAVAYKQEGHTFTKLREAFGMLSDTYYKWKERLSNGYYDIKMALPGIEWKGGKHSKIEA